MSRNRPTFCKYLSCDQHLTNLNLTKYLTSNNNNIVAKIELATFFFFSGNHVTSARWVCCSSCNEFP